MRLLLAAAFALASADAATKVAVIELGKAGTVRRTTSKQLETSTDGVASFWSALHGYGRKLQHAGMTVVPDLFARPESGVVLGLTGVDLDEMPALAKILTEEENGVVGHMEVPGHQCSSIVKHVQNVEEIELTSLSNTFEAQATTPGISAMKMDVTKDVATNLDMQLARMIQRVSDEASNGGKTVVLHLIVEEDDGASRRRRLARRLEGEDNNNNQDQNRDGENQDNADNQDDDAVDAEDGNGNNQQYAGYYGYGYYNAYGEWVTPYKTMFQIQYFNVVLWTSIGLVAILGFALYLFVFMPLMADTLLFGESARIANDD